MNSEEALKALLDKYIPEPNREELRVVQCYRDGELKGDFRVFRGDIRGNPIEMVSYDDEERRGDYVAKLVYSGERKWPPVEQH